VLYPPCCIGCASSAVLYWLRYIRRTVLAVLYPPCCIGCASSAVLYWLRYIRRTVLAVLYLHIVLIYTEC